MPGTQVVHAVQDAEFRLGLKVPAAHGLHVMSAVVVPAEPTLFPAEHEE